MFRSVSRRTGPSRVHGPAPLRSRTVFGLAAGFIGAHGLLRSKDGPHSTARNRGEPFLGLAANASLLLTAVPTVLLGRRSQEKCYSPKMAGGQTSAVVRRLGYHASISYRSGAAHPREPAGCTPLHNRGYEVHSQDGTEQSARGTTYWKNLRRPRTSGVRWKPWSNSSSFWRREAC
jgi:hypothetical protein